MKNNRMMRPAWVFVLCAWCLCLPWSRLRAQETGPETNLARQLFQSGVEHYEAGELTQALADFQRAYALKPHPLVEVNIANCYDKLNLPAEALTHFEAFLSSSEGSPAQRDEVRAALARLSQSAGRLSIRATPASALGVIDGHQTAQPLQWVSAGNHRYDVSAEGYESASRVVDVHAGETVEVSVDLAPQTKAPALSAATTPQPSPEAAPQPPTAAQVATAPEQAPPPAATGHAPLTATPSIPTNVWVSGGATFGLGVIAVVTGQLALAANREFDTNLSALRNPTLTEYQRAGAWARGVEAADRADTLAAVTDILLAFTFVGVGLTTYFYLSDKNASEQSRVRVALRTDASSGQLQLRGAF